MLLWLDDIRDPCDFGFSGYYWAKTAEEAITIFRTTMVDKASLDHDLTYEQMEGGILGEVREDGHKSGYDVVMWLEEHPKYWPPNGVRVHSQNPAGRQRMEQVVYRHYGRNF
jgi:hypothetical protein